MKNFPIDTYCKNRPLCIKGIKHGDKVSNVILTSINNQRWRHMIIYTYTHAHTYNVSKFYVD